MLSRAAQRVYWTGRYLERAENTARIVQQYSQLLLDLPEEVGVGWFELVRIVGATDEYRASGKPDTETDILEFLLADAEGYSSLAYALRMARENVRIRAISYPTKPGKASTSSTRKRAAVSGRPRKTKIDSRFSPSVSATARRSPAY